MTTATHEENSFTPDSFLGVNAMKDDVLQTEEQTRMKTMASTDVPLNDVDWTEPFQLEEQDSDIRDLLRDIAKIDWNDDFFPEMNTSISRADHSMEFREDDSFSEEILEILHVKFGLESFRPGQREIINAILNGHDCFVLMPTGGGKSLCYQLPALLTKGVTVVISPLIALICDQVDKLKALDIRAEHLCCTLTRTETQNILSKLYLSEPDIDLLYVTPEKVLGSYETAGALDLLYKRGKLARFVLDEVHCLSLWGHDFRPHYKQLSLLREKFSNIQIVCFTATATQQVETDVIINLNLRNVKRFIQSFNRPNIKYQVIDKYPETASSEIARLIRLKFLNQCGIIYCLKRKDCVRLSKYLNCMDIAAKPYHAGLEDKVREKTQREWMQNEFHVIVATIAFGMGIDKPDVRFVIHNTIPKSLEAFYQESGRAGRDGKTSYSYVFYNYEDVLRTMELMDDDFTKKHTLDGHFDNLEQMVAFANNQVDCRRYLQLLNLGETFDRRLCMQNKETVCDNCENFSSHKQPDVDVTKQAKELSMLVRDITSRTKITLNAATKIYKGSSSRSRERNTFGRRFQTYRYFGSGRLLTRLDIHRILRDLILRNILAHHYITTGDFPIVYIKPGSELQEFLSSPNVKVTIPAARRRCVQNVRVPTEYPTLSGFVRTNLSLSPLQYETNNIKIWCQESLLELCLSCALEKGVSVSSVLHPAAVRCISEILPRNKEELLKIQHVTVAIIDKMGEEILAITNDFRSKIQSLQRRAIPEPQEVMNNRGPVGNDSGSHKRTHSEAFSVNNNYETFQNQNHVCNLL